MLAELLEQEVVVDLEGPFVCLGVLRRFDDQFLELAVADLHDLRDSSVNRENYVAAARRDGVIPNRQRVLLVRRGVVAIARLDDCAG